MKISISAKQVGELYHYTTKRALLNILRSGKLALSTGRGTSVETDYQGGKSYFASFTRSRFGGYHYGEGRTSIHEDTKVLLTLDGDALSARETIRPVDYWQKRGDLAPGIERNKEVEERLVSDRSEIPILKYIKRVDLIQRAVHGEAETYGFGRGKFRVRPNERHQKELGSIILQLKKNGIQFGFFNSVEEWAKKRGEYSYIGKKDVNVDGPATFAPSSRSYRDLLALVECLSDLPYEKLGPTAQKMCANMLRYPSDVSALFNDYENFRKPTAGAVMRTAALKVARALKRRGFTTKSEAGQFIAAKYDVYLKEAERIQRQERAKKLFPVLIEALTKPVSEWSPDSSHGSARNLFLNISDRFSYLYDDAVRTIKSALESGADLGQLRSVMASMSLVDANDIVSHVWYEKVQPLKNAA